MTIVHFESYEKSIFKALDEIKACKQIAGQARVLIKPNLTNSSPHPITTSSECCEAIVKYVQRCSDAQITIAEGCGDGSMETDEIFSIRGYVKLAQKYKIKLEDLNTSALTKRENKNCTVFPFMHLPKIAFESYIISVPVLKAHSLSGITGTLKNMMGFAPPKYYSGDFGTWKKAVFHEQMQQSIIDLNKYLIPHLSVMDCSIGLADFHLGGPECQPAVNKIIAKYNPWETDREACKMLGLDPEKIAHVKAGFD